MILAQIKQYLRQQRQVSLWDLAKRFNSEPTALLPMLELWIRKGQLLKCETKFSCATKCHQCRQCDPLMLELFQWVD